MYITVSQGFSVDDRSVIGIFDLDNSTRSQDTRKFLRKSEKQGEVRARSRDIPKCFLLCDDFVCLVQTASTQMVGRARQSISTTDQW